MTSNLESAAINSKSCSKCKEVKPIAQFHKQKGREYGVASQCKDCRSTAPAKEGLPHGMKRCTVCKQIKIITDFYVRHGKRAGQVNPECKLCSNKKSANYYGNNREAMIAHATAWAAKNPDKKAIIRSRAHDKLRALKAADPETFIKLNRKSWLKRYGLTLEQFDVQLEKQHGKCVICGRAFNESWRPCVDHCHNGGHVRGILCLGCNTAIGLLNTPRGAA